MYTVNNALKCVNVYEQALDKKPKVIGSWSWITIFSDCLVIFTQSSP